MRVKNVRFRVFARKDEARALTEALKNFLPEGVAVSEEVLPPEAEAGVFKEPLIQITARAEKRRQVEAVMRRLLDGLNEKDLRKLRAEAESRTDEDGNFYLRLGKADFADGKLVLWRKNPIHVKVKVECHPKSKANAVKVLEELLGGEKV